MASVHIKGYIKQTVKREIENILDRHIVLAKNGFPYEANEEFYHKILGAELISKLLDLRDNYPQGFISTSKHIIITLPEAKLIDKRAFLIKMDKRYMLPPRPSAWDFRPTGYAFEITSRSHPDIAPPLEEWGAKVVETIIAIRKAKEIINASINACRTGGQLRKLCPDLVNFLDHKLQEKLGETVSRNYPRLAADIQSALPSAVTIVASGIMLPEENTLTDKDIYTLSYK